VARVLCEAMAQRGEEVVALTQRVRATDPADECAGNPAIYRYGSPRLRALLGMSVSTALGIGAPLARILRSRSFDAAIGHQPASSLSAARALRERGIPELRFFHASGAQETMLRLAPGGPAHLRRLAGNKVARDLRVSQHWKLERAYVRGADHLCFLSHYTQEWARRLHGPVLPPSTVIPAGVDTDLFRPPEDRRLLRRALLGDQDNATILFTARNLAPRMGIDALLRALPALLRAYPAIRLVIAGDGALRARLEQLAADLGIGNRVSFLGRIPDAELIAWYQACDLFVLPSAAMEGFGMVTVEAMACGAPVVGTPVGATPELLAGHHPHLLALGTTPDDLAGAIIRVLRDCDLPALRRQVRAHAVARYSIGIQAERVAGLLRQLARGRGGTFTAETRRRHGENKKPRTSSPRGTHEVGRRHGPPSVDFSPHWSGERCGPEGSVCGCG
jgi:glycosyltransferase involved in cell wall biosynthesis